METLRTYYNRRAEFYEKIYKKPERRSDLCTLTQELLQRFANRRVLEIACGTGYWTQRFAPTALQVLAIDQSVETLSIAQEKAIPNATFLQDDAYTLFQVQGAFDAAYAGFWWSHIPLGRIASFLEALHAKLQPKARVVFVDNIYVEGSSTPLSRHDADGNSYQQRSLPDGSSYEVLKNFPTDESLAEAIAPYSHNLEIQRLRYYWLMQYELA